MLSFLSYKRKLNLVLGFMAVPIMLVYNAITYGPNATEAQDAANMKGNLCILMICTTLMIFTTIIKYDGPVIVDCFRRIGRIMMIPIRSLPRSMKWGYAVGLSWIAILPFVPTHVDTDGEATAGSLFLAMLIIGACALLGLIVNGLQFPDKAARWKQWLKDEFPAD